MSSIEYVLFLKTQQVCLFKLPPLSTSKGYYLDDWKEMFWEGGCKLTEKGGQLFLHFIDQNTQSVQTTVILPEDPYQALQKTVDSQRGYAVRLTTPTGQYQWVGCVFRDRNDAFDLMDRLQKFLEQKDMEKNPKKFDDMFKPQIDFSLKQGEKIQISFGVGAEKKQSTQQQKQPVDLSQLKFEAPPDFDFGDFNSSKPAQAQPQQQQWGSFDFQSDFADFGKANNQPSSFANNQPYQQPKPQFQAAQPSFPAFQAAQPLAPQQLNKKQDNNINLLDL
ncbi:Adaptin ear-binding coat-associated protein 1 [Paramecium bursaria]